VDELAALPGVGPSLAAAIVADRQAKGSFKTLTELDRVRGVGPAILQQIKPFVLQSP
jgi:competence protein ComEA